MKILVLLATLCVSTLANATLYGYRCKGLTADTGDTVRMRGAFDSYSNEHVGNLEILGTDTEPADSSFPGGGSEGAPRKFPANRMKVKFDEDAGFLGLSGRTDNQSTILATIVRGAPSNFINIDLKPNAVAGYYKHRFSKSARCTFRQGAMFPDDWNF